MARASISESVFQPGPAGRVGKLALSFAWLLLVTTAAWPQSGTRLPLRVEASNIEPNYPLTRDKRDLEQLTDQLTVPFPAWTRRESVGWSHRTPVLLTVRVMAGAARQVRLMTAKNLSADVLPPARVDAYCGRPQAGWVHVGNAVPKPDAVADRTSLWVDVPFDSPCSGELALVLHARGSFLMVDEIEAHGSLQATAMTAPGQEPGVHDGSIIGDSIRRLRARYVSDNEARVSTLLREKASRQPFAWLVNPWQDLAPGQWQADMSRTELSLSAAEGWPVSFVVGMANASTEPATFRASLCEAAASRARFSELVPVLAANGQMIPDALRTLDRQELPVGLGSLGWLYVTLDAPVHTQTCEVRISSGDRTIQDLRLKLTDIGRLPSSDSAAPKAGTWAYLSDKPIWTRENQADLVRALVSAGVNVFVIHPDSIPVPGAKANWEVAAKLRSDLAAYRGAGTVLLYLAWDRAGVGKDDSGPGQREVAQWLERLLPLMEAAGYSYADWALYPMDEPGPDDYAWLLRISRWIKERNDQVRLYANPGRVGLADLVPGSSLQELVDVIDIWQPLRGEAADRLAPVLRKKAPDRWWIYQVGLAPAKAIPPRCYRSSGAAAARLGAAGFGFWSFSDTGGSSAWDDFDGRRPDWAVVYEDANGGILSSRRWEAFQQGIRDFSALKACENAVNSPACESLAVVLRDVADADGCR